VCALILQKIGGVTVSATMERRPELPRDWIKASLPRCVGGRIHDGKLLEAPNGSFVMDKTSGFHLIPPWRDTKFWQQWAELLLRWSCSDQKSKACPERAERVEWIENRK